MTLFLYPPKTALLAPSGSKPFPLHIVSTDETLVDISSPGPEHLFYNDVVAEDAAYSKSPLKTHSWRYKILPPSAEGVRY